MSRKSAPIRSAPLKSTPLRSSNKACSPKICTSEISFSKVFTVDGAGATRRQPRGRRDRAARHHQRRAVLRRCGDHAGAVGALGDRRHQARHRCVRSLCRAADGGHSAGAVCGAVARYGARRRLLRAGDVRLVRRHRDRGDPPDHAASRGACLRSIRSMPSRS